MSIKEYKRGEHKGGFIGVRVVVSVDGKYCQKYFGFRGVTTEEQRDKLRAEAKKLNAEWNMERDLAKSRRQRNSKETRRVSSPFTTGVSGIKMKFASSQFTSVRGVKKHYYAPYFVVSGSTDGVRFDNTFSILKQGYDFAWFNAVGYYAGQKGMNSYSHLLERKPPVEQFYVIYKYQCSMGHDIPISRLPTEVSEELIEKLKVT